MELSCLLPPDVADKVVSSSTSVTKALPTSGLSKPSLPSVPRVAKKAFTPPPRAKKDIGINASEFTLLTGGRVFSLMACVWAGENFITRGRHVEISSIVACVCAY